MYSIVINIGTACAMANFRPVPSLSHLNGRIGGISVFCVGKDGDFEIIPPIEM